MRVARSGLWVPGRGGGEEGLLFKSDGVVHWRIQIKPIRRPMWVWLKFKLTPKGDFCVVNVMAFFVNFFMYSINRYLNGRT